MGKNKGQCRHDRIVDQLEDLLMRDNDYRIWQFLEYNKSDHFVRDVVRRGTRGKAISTIGEIDLLRRMDDYWEFYEIKSHYSNKSRKCAANQYARFREQFKRDNVVGYLYCGHRIQLL